VRDEHLGRRWAALSRGPYPESVLRAAFWLVRAAAYALIGIETSLRVSGRPAAVAMGAYGLCGVLLAAFAVFDIRTSQRPGLMVLLGVVAAVSGAVCVVANGGSLLGLTLLAALSAATDGTVAAGWGVTILGIAGIEVSGQVTGATQGVLLGYPAALLVALLVGRTRRAHRLHAEETSALLAEVERLQDGQRRAAVLDERTRIAREIHDVLAHSLGALGIQIQTARALLDHDTRRADDVLEVAQRMAADGLGETRRAVQALRTDMAPLPQALAKIAEAHRGQAALTVRGEPAALPSEQILSLVRVAQESLVNAAKHAPGQAVAITVHYEDDHVRMTITNPLGDSSPGVPDLATVDGGYGLTGMRERLLLLGGGLTAESRGRQWSVTARVPR
jgi:signal transduction histidine kinase